MYTGGEDLIFSSSNSLQSNKKGVIMTINIKTAERAVNWGAAGFGLLTAIVSMVGLIAEAKNGKSVKVKPDN